MKEELKPLHGNKANLVEETADLIWPRELESEGLN